MSSSYLPRIAVLVLVVLAATAGITFAAGGVSNPPAPAATTASAPAGPATVTVPDLESQAFVFAKQQLQDGGFAWRVAGSVHGYPSNTVVSQSPAPGTKLLDTGTPLVTVTLARNAKYPQAGSPEDTSPYAGTPVRLADDASALLPAKTAKAATTTTTTTTSATATATTATTTTAPERSALPARTHAKRALPQNRPPAFDVPGGKKEPLDEIPLTWRAANLGTWLRTHPTPTSANEQYWLYQNDWVVAGAKLGWWHGAQALRTLVAVDARTQQLWGVGSKSEAVAREALAEVEARSR